MTAFVLGNGRSRSGVDINHLMKIGAVYGCNGLYRTHRPTALIATDRAIAAEIQRSGYSAHNRFYTRRPIDGLGAIMVPKQYFGFSSGPIAMAIAAADQHDPIYLLGFDMGATQEGKFNNIYADTDHYKKSDATPTYTGNWIRQMCTVARDHADHRFIRIHGPTVAMIPEFDAVANMAKMDFAAFMTLINTSKD